MMDRWQYLAVLAACIVITVPLEVFLGARVYRRPARLAATLGPVIAVFATWDLIAARLGHWWWSAELVTGLRLLTLPIEEWLFFLVVPVCALLTYEVLGRRTAHRAEARPDPATPDSRSMRAQVPGERTAAGHGR